VWKEVCTEPDGPKEGEGGVESFSKGGNPRPEGARINVSSQKSWEKSNSLFNARRKDRKKPY